MKKLTLKHQLFCDEYLLKPDAAAAAIKAGYKEKYAAKAGCDILKKETVQQYLKEKRERLSVKTEITHEKVLREYAKIAFSNIKDFQSWEDGVITLKDSARIKRKKSACISEISETVSERGIRTLKIKLHDKKGALDSIAKHLGMFVERREVSGPNGKPIEVKTQEIDLSHLSNEEMIEYRRLAQKILVDTKKKTNVTCDDSNP